LRRATDAQRRNFKDVKVAYKATKTPIAKMHQPRKPHLTPIKEYASRSPNSFTSCEKTT